MNRSEYFSSDFTKLNVNRTLMSMPFQHRTAFNTGDIIPLMVEPIYPGDTWKTKLSYLLRLFTPMKAIYSNMFIDFYAFFVPNRLTWTHWTQFLGENDSGAWTQTNVYTIPQNEITGTLGTYLPNDCLAQYLGINQTLDAAGTSYSTYVSDLFRRAYIEIWNQWFRSENLIAPLLYSKGDTPETTQVYAYYDHPLKAAKFHDYFTVLLPEPMKGTPPVIGKDLPVVASSTESVSSGDVASALVMRTISGGKASSYPNTNALGTYNHNVASFTYVENANVGSSVTPANLWATMTITIEDIRKAAVATHVMEKLATSGSRYPEFLQGMWGVTAPNAELQIPELLGSQRFPIRISEVVSNADTDTGSAGEILGATGAMVKTGNTGALFNKAFTEYGQLWVECVVRIEQNYFQGLARKFTDKSFFDFYIPAMANIGNQPVEKKRLLSDVSDPDAPFGYSEPWAHLRHLPYLTTSIMKPTSALGLSAWSADDIYSVDSNGTISLNKAFLEQNAYGLDRCIAVPSASRGSFQWFGDFHFDNEVTRVLPAHSLNSIGRI